MKKAASSFTEERLCCIVVKHTGFGRRLLGSKVWLGLQSVV